MTRTSYHIFLNCIYLLMNCIFLNAQDVSKLPYCSKDVKHSEFIMVSTLDGLLTTLKPDGSVAWHIKTGPGALLSSNIHRLELTNNGQWVRIIPSLSGTLYKFDGITIDPIPISADMLLTSSFRYSDDLLIAGGREVRTYGVQLNSGYHLYECALDGCKNTTNYANELDEVILVERKTHTVRAVEPRTGIERWNFSVGQHDIKIPYINCIDVGLKPTNMNISAVLPEGLLIANKVETSTEILWQKRFDSPIVAVWRWNGRELIPINLFSSPSLMNINCDLIPPSIYVGMHNKQLYIHESLTMQHMLFVKQQSVDKYSVIESQSLTQIPWKPISAVNVAIKNLVEETDDSTALSVLYGSEYVNGNGYYLYTEEKEICNSDNVTNITSIDENNINLALQFSLNPVFVISVIIIILCQLLYVLYINDSRNIKAKNKSSDNAISLSNRSYSESEDRPFTSRYITEFQPISCLGKGGFGIVFQARKKFDECDYAIKRITLPNKPAAKDRMMREVKALAKLDHRNIVRYYNAWIECPPHDWLQLHDEHWLKDFSSYTDHSVSTHELSNKIECSLPINIEAFDIPAKIDHLYINKQISSEDGSSVVFLNNTHSETTEMVQRNSNEESVLNISFIPSTPVYLYIQMQLCCRESLKDWLNNSFHRDHCYAIAILKQIVEAVEYVHFRGLIHRDLKPSNIFFSLEGLIKVGDFGLVTSIKEYDDNGANLVSKCMKQNYTNAVGTQLYMSPEQLKGQQYDYKVDIYSLGIIFFELLVPFKTEMERITVLTDLRNYRYPKDFCVRFSKEYELLNQMLSVDPQKRPTAKGILEQLSLKEYFNTENLEIPLVNLHHV